MRRQSFKAKSFTNFINAILNSPTCVVSARDYLARLACQDTHSPILTTHVQIILKTAVTAIFYGKVTSSHITVRLVEKEDFLISLTVFVPSRLAMLLFIAVSATRSATRRMAGHTILSKHCFPP